MSRSLLEVPSCSTASAELKLYRAFIFSIPIFFTFFLLLLFYLYLHCTRADRSSLQIRHNTDSRAASSSKELRELLPVIVFKESFSARDMQISMVRFSYGKNDVLTINRQPLNILKPSAYFPKNKKMSF
ncbi:RING-H2 finger protein ATL58-like isoform X2 [Malania oleifera]|uniref:RING-H2 finger protein ATL58-like isoform X2 n=1 Tax=Malania oleifera TaxID=397392 RepID=UPI0025ADD6DD|nr:RING-H2 finger protein ATL58-like isoform X2 [Malania oleifera]